jgi:hypothetical protein
MSFPQESQLEKYIKDFVRKKTAEAVELHLQEACIALRALHHKRSILLAKFWANVLQNVDNFPIKSHEYHKNIDNNILSVKADNTALYVDMTTGELVLKGEFVYDWFNSNFKRLLDNCDPDFASSWTFTPTPVVKLAGDESDEPLKDCMTGIHGSKSTSIALNSSSDIEKYQLGFLQKIPNAEFEGKIQSLILPDFRELYVDLVSSFVLVVELVIACIGFRSLGAMIIWTQNCDG